MPSVNKVILLGNVGKDPEIRALQNGNKVANFPLATSESWKDKATGERKERTEWHNIVVFNIGLVNLIEKYIVKGSQLYISGSIQTRKWQDKQGNDRYSTEIVLQGYDCAIQMLGGKQDNNQHTVDKGNAYAPSNKDEDIDDSFPF